MPSNSRGRNRRGVPIHQVQRTRDATLSEVDMPNTDTLLPSDILMSASDELGDTLAAVRAQALDAAGDMRDDLFDVYKKLVSRQQKIMLRGISN